MRSRYTYFKRYRMEVDLRRPPAGALGPAPLPDGFAWVPWHDRLLDPHAEVKALSFLDELDALVFPSLGSLPGCRDLMYAIRGRPGFCPGATWLVAAPPGDAGWPGSGCVATIQGVIDEHGHGAVQNVGVLPDYRGRGIGRALVVKALHGFAAAGARRAFLEVTAQNAPAVRTYRGLGFRSTRTIYKAVPAREPVGAGS